MFVRQRIVAGRDPVADLQHILAADRRQQQVVTDRCVGLRARARPDAVMSWRCCRPRCTEADEPDREDIGRFREALGRRGY